MNRGLRYDRHGRVNWQHPVSDHDLNNGLVSWWLVGQHAGWRGGNILRDLKGVNHGTLTNGPTWGGALGRPGGFGSLGFVAASSHLCTAPYISAIETPSFYITFWAKAADWNTVWKGVVCQRIIEGNPTIPGITIGHRLNGIRVTLCDGTDETGVNEAALTGLTAGKWHFISAVINRTTNIVRAGIDATQFAEADISAIGSISRAATEFTIGGLTAVASFDGEIDHVRVGLAALSDSQIVELKQDSLRGYPLTLNRIRRATVFDVGAAAARSGARNLRNGVEDTGGAQQWHIGTGVSLA